MTAVHSDSEALCSPVAERLAAIADGIADALRCYGESHGWDAPLPNVRTPEERPMMMTDDDLAMVEAANELRALGVTDEQMGQVTGFGLRRLEGCAPEDTILRKYATGALSAHGVMKVLYGTDSPQHNAGTALLG